MALVELSNTRLAATEVHLPHGTVLVIFMTDEAGTSRAENKE